MQRPRSARYGAERVIGNLVIYGENDGLALQVEETGLYSMIVYD